MGTSVACPSTPWPDMAAKESSLDEELVKAGPRVAHHMNADHADSLLAWVHHYAKLDGAVAAECTGVTREGFELRVTLADGSVAPQPCLVRYPSPLQSAGELRKLAVKMHFEAYGELGVVYRFTHVFYPR